MATLIGTLILFGSLIGMAVIILRRIPVLVNLSESQVRSGREILLDFKKRFRFQPFINFSKDKFLKKLLLKAKILTLKAENRTSDLLQKLNHSQAAKRKRDKFQDDYWKKLREKKDN